MIKTLRRLECYFLLAWMLLLSPAAMATTPWIDPGPSVTDIEQIAGQSLKGIKTLIQDRAGFMWLATNDGLLRFDGHSLKRFTHDEQDPHSLAHNDIRGILEDPDGMIWLITRGGGLSRFSPLTEQFEHFSYQPDDPTTLDSDQLNAISLAPPDKLWISSNQGINLFDRKTLKNQRLNAMLQPSKESVAENVVKIFQDKQQRLWYSVARKGLYLQLAKSGKLLHFVHDPADPHSLDDNTVTKIYQTTDGQLWIGTAVSINRFNPAKLNFDRFAIPLKDSNKVNHASVTSLFEDQQHTLWIGTFYNGVSWLAQGSNTIVNVNHHAMSKDSLNALHINDIFADSSGTLWFVTPRSGLIKLTPDALLFEHQLVRANGTESIRVLLTDSQGRLWLGTQANLYHWDPVQSSFTQVAKDVGAFTAMAETLDHRLIIAIDGQGLFSLDLQTEQLSRFAAQLPLGNVDKLIVDPSGQLWAGLNNPTGGGGVYRFEPQRSQWFGVRKGLTVNQLLAVDKYILLATEQPGIQIFDTVTQRWSERQLTGLQGAVEVMYVDDKQRLWLANSAVGLAQWDLANDSLHLVRSVEKTVITTIVADQQGLLWLGTPQGIVSYDPSTAMTQSYGQQQGIRTPLFSASMSVALAGRKLVLANSGGLVRFSPTKLNAMTAQQTSTHLIMFSDFKLFNQSVPLRAVDPLSPLITTIDKTDAITLNYKQNWFSIAFASNAYDQQEQLRYAYKMAGLSNQWIETSGDDRVASFTSVAAGDYVFMVKVSGADGQNNEVIRQLKITITPPWWAATMAYIVYVVVGVGLIVLFNGIRTRQLRRRAAILEQGIAERTVELRQRADTISQLLEDKEALLLDKDRLIANISHEFRTPLTLILGPLTTEIQTAANEKSKALLSLAQANGQRLLAMVDQLLDMARLKDLPPSTLQAKDVIQTCQFLLASFRSLAEQNGIELMAELSPSSKDDPVLLVMVQPDALEKMLSNLLSNAFKYGAEGHLIQLGARVIEDQQVQIWVMDQGQGISLADQQQIFERFIRLKNSSGYMPGAGIGLALVKDLVEQHHGTLRVESVLGQGSKFIITLPLWLPVNGGGLIDNKAGQGVNEALVLAAIDQMKDCHRPQPLDPEFNNEAVEDVMQDSGSGELERILVVEDNQDMRQYIVSCLSDCYQCSQAADGEAGVLLAQTMLPDLIVSDVMMPKMNGFEVTRALKNDPATSHIPIILLTARGDASSKIEGLLQKADEFLEKPFNTTELLVRIANLLVIRRLLSQRYHSEFTNSPLLINAVVAEDQVPEEKSTTTAELPVNPIHQVFLDQIKQVLATHSSKDSFDVGQFALEMALSHRQLGRKMKALIDMTPAEALRDFRLTQAAQLLSQGVSPSVVFHRVGFTTHSHFSQCFKVKYGCNPSVYLQTVNPAT